MLFSEQKNGKRQTGFVAVCARTSVLIGLAMLVMFRPGPVMGAENYDFTREWSEMPADDSELFFSDEEGWDGQDVEVIHDPLEPLNRMVFSFNDMLYFWVLKPVGQVYSRVIPEPPREWIYNFFYNLRSPIRLTNGLLQGKMRLSGDELARFLINSTLGIGGFFDPARDWLDLSGLDEDTGQTLGKYGFGEGIYLYLPIYGPSCLRDSLGLVGNYYLDPLSSLAMDGNHELYYTVRAGEELNKVSLRLSSYEEFKDATFDPYSAMRDAYVALRRSKINDENYR